MLHSFKIALRGVFKRGSERLGEILRWKLGSERERGERRLGARARASKFNLHPKCGAPRAPDGASAITYTPPRAEPRSTSLTLARTHEHERAPRIHIPTAVAIPLYFQPSGRAAHFDPRRASRTRQSHSLSLAPPPLLGPPAIRAAQTALGLYVRGVHNHPRPQGN